MCLERGVKRGGSVVARAIQAWLSSKIVVIRLSREKGRDIVSEMWKYMFRKWRRGFIAVDSARYSLSMVLREMQSCNFEYQ
jgi:hypothetical protein